MAHPKLPRTRLTRISPFDLKAGYLSPPPGFGFARMKCFKITVAHLFAGKKIWRQNYNFFRRLLQPMRSDWLGLISVWDRLETLNTDFVAKRRSYLQRSEFASWQEINPPVLAHAPLTQLKNLAFASSMFFVVVACHEPVLDGFDWHYQASVLSKNINKSWQNR